MIIICEREMNGGRFRLVEKGTSYLNTIYVFSYNQSSTLEIVAIRSFVLNREKNEEKKNNEKINMKR